jgi:hypothetical protein
MRKNYWWNNWNYWTNQGRNKKIIKISEGDYQEAAEKVAQKNSELENIFSNSLFFMYLNYIIWYN